MNGRDYRERVMRRQEEMDVRWNEKERKTRGNAVSNSLRLSVLRRTSVSIQSEYCSYVHHKYRESSLL